MKSLIRIMKYSLILSALALMSCEKQDHGTMVHRNVIVVGSDTIVIESIVTDTSFRTSESVSKCHSPIHGHGDTIEIIQPVPKPFKKDLLGGTVEELLPTTEIPEGCTHHL